VPTPVTWQFINKKKGSGEGQGFINHISGVNGNNIEECRKQCEGNPECGSIAVDSKKRECWFYKGHIGNRNGDTGQSVHLKS
jgi:hypothetical protein